MCEGALSNYQHTLYGVTQHGHACDHKAQSVTHQMEFETDWGCVVRAGVRRFTPSATETRTTVSFYYAEQAAIQT